jgi:hypothetical protein
MRLPSLLLSTAARDPGLIAPLDRLAPRGSRLTAAYFVVARGQNASPLSPPQHGGARSVVIRQSVSLPWAARLTGSLTKVRCIETTGQETTHELEQPVR